MGVDFVPPAIDPSSITKARKLRRRMTDGEKKLWSELREFRLWYGIHVRRQSPIGPFVADFVVHDMKLVIEIDGEHHRYPDRFAEDAKRDPWFHGESYEVFRISSGDVWDNFDGCIEEILRKVGVA